MRRRQIAADLARVDPGGLRAWLKYAVAVERALGVEMSRRYSALVLAASRRDTRLGRELTTSLPDHLARVRAERRGEYLALMTMVVDERPGAAQLTARTLPELIEKLSGEQLREFLRSGLELHNPATAGGGGGERRAAHFLRQESRQGREAMESLTTGVHLKEVRRVMTHYARAHCGEDVQIRPASPSPTGGRAGAYSDGRHVYLPERVDRYGDERDFMVYRVITARTAGHLEFGTYDLDLEQVEGDWVEARPGELDIERMLRSFPNRSLARDLFQLTEDARVEAHVRDEYPGIARDMDVLKVDELSQRSPLQELAPVEQLIEALGRRARGLPVPPAELAPAVLSAADKAWERLSTAILPGATVGDVALQVGGAYGYAWALMRSNEPTDGPPEPSGGGKNPFQGGGDSGDEPGEPERPKGGGGDWRGESDEGNYQPREDDGMSGGIRPEAMTAEDRESETQARDALEAMREEGLEASLAELRRALRGREVSRGDERSYEEMVAFLERHEAPSGGIVEESDEEEGEALLRRGGMDNRSGRPVDLDADPNAATFIYKEWDGSIEDYKPSWVRLKEHKLKAGDRAFVDRVREEHGLAIRQLRRRFEALRPSAYARARGLPDGDDLDLDRVIAARVARRAGGSPSTRLYTKHLRERRDVAVAFLLDLSSSTNEVAGESGKRIIEVEKEALTIIAEAIDVIGDAFAIYGFSGYGRDHVAFYTAKDFSDPYDDRARSRIGRMNWKMENRDGAAIRHATRKVVAQRSRSKLLILLSDGRPLDCGCDHYFDQYAQDDTRMALREARAAGVHPFCITVDPRGSRYLESIYGEVGYTVIERAESLPDQLPRIYRRLTR